MEIQGIREATFDERATWGTCPVCGAPHGENCHPEVGVQLGRTVSGRPLQQGEGAHLARLQKAPAKVAMVRAG